jgi:hypothetical protein
VVELVLIVIGVVVGLAVGRWWVLLAAVALGVWIGLVSEVDEVAPWFLGLGYGVLAGAGIVVGVLVRGRLR